MSTRRWVVLGVGAVCIASGADAQQSQQPPQQELDRVEIRGNYDNAVGTSDAASQGVVTSRLIEARPVLRPAEVLEFVPGLIVTQHSGGGKANQYFLRGFNLDHGTDFSTHVDGMPVNMPTNAHGQGYSDLNWLIPELIDRIEYRKGPYSAADGDFASAGSAGIVLADKLRQGLLSLTAGQRGYESGLVANSNAVAGGQLLYAVEAMHNDGPWQVAEKLHKLSGVLRYSVADAGSASSLTAMAYSAGWNATDQIPLRAVQSGTLDRFGAISDTDGGKTSRFSLSFQTRQTMADGVFKLNAYAIHSELQLFSDFTYFLDDPVNGDQFEQAERRNVFGGGASRSWNTVIAGRDVTNTLGIEMRQDRIDPVGSYSTVDRIRTATVQESVVRQTSVGLYFQNATQWLPWLRSIAGVRGDGYRFDVHSAMPQNSGKVSDQIASPKLALVFGPWSKTEYFANYGWGFHSNDARGTTTTVTPKEGLPATPAPGLVRSRGGELGLRTEIVPGLQSSLALWRLDLDSELVFSGDAGDTAPSRPSRRTGIELNNHYVARPWLLFDADISVSRARYTQPDPVGDRVPGSVGTVVSLGATVTDFGPWSGQLQWRYFGPRPLIEDNSQKSRGTTLAYARVGYRISKDVRLNLDIFNLFDRRASDIDYYYASRLQGEPATGVNDVHFHPVEPRSVRLTLRVNF